MWNIESDYVQGYLAGYRGEFMLGNSAEYRAGYKEGAEAE